MKLVAASLLTLLIPFACGPGTPSKPPPAPGGAGGAGRGYILRLDALDKHASPTARKAECTVTAFSAPDKIVTVDGKPYNNHYKITIGGAGYKLRIFDNAEAVTIDWACIMTGRPGDEFLCTVTKMGGGSANFIGEVHDRDVIAPGDNTAGCDGTINARS